MQSLEVLGQNKMPSGPDFMLIVKRIAMLDLAINGGRKWYGRGLYSEVEKLLCIHEGMATVSRWRNTRGAAYKLETFQTLSL